MPRIGSVARRKQKVAAQEAPQTIAAAKALGDLSTCIPKWRRDPVAFAQQALGFRPWARQSELLQATRKYRRVTCRSANKVGKTAIAAVAVLDFLIHHPGSLVITTAPGLRQVEGALWKEIRRLWSPRQHIFGGEMPPRAAELRLDGVQWRAIGFTTNSAHKFHGFAHAEQLVVVDEASEIEDDIFEALASLLASEGSRLLYIGNPMKCSGRFFESHQPEKSVEKNPAGFYQMHISALDSPNVVAGKEMIPGLASRVWVEEMQTDYGEESPEYRARVLGEFPDEDDWTLVPLSWLHQAMSPDSKPEATESVGERRMGVDVAGKGPDSTVACIRNDREILAMKYMPKSGMCGTDETADWIARTGADFAVPDRSWALDAGNIGGPIAIRLKQLGHYLEAVEFGGNAQDNMQHTNRRAEMYWRLRMRLHPTAQAAPFYIPATCKGLKAQLPVMKYRTHEGRTRVQDKQEIRARLRRSPDEADALALTFAFNPKSEPRIWVL